MRSVGVVMLSCRGLLAATRLVMALVVIAGVGLLVGSRAEGSVGGPLEEGSGVAEVRLDSATGVASAWLVNGVRVHAMELDSIDERVHVSVSFSGGRLGEPEGGWLSTTLAAGLVVHPSFDGLLGGEVPVWLSVQGVVFEVGAGEDSMVVSMAFLPEKLGVAMGALERFLRGGAVLGGGVFEAARADLAQKHAEINGSTWRGGLAFASAALSGDARFGVVDPASILALTEADVRGAFDRHVRIGAVEAAIVGPMDVGDGLGALAGALGVLGERSRGVVGGGVSDWRLVGGMHEWAAGDDGFSTVVVAAGAPGASRTRGFRVSRTAAMVLEGRLQRMLVDDRGGDDASGLERVEVLVRPWGRDGVLLVVARVEVGREAEFVEMVFGEIEGLGPRGGVGDRQENIEDVEGELSAVLSRLSEAADTHEADGRYWSAVLSRLEMSGFALREIAPARSMYGSIGWSDVLEYARGFREGVYGRAAVVVRPKAAGADQE